MYQKMYTTLFNAVTKALVFLKAGDVSAASWILEEGQRETENLFMDWDWEQGDGPDEGPETPS